MHAFLREVWSERILQHPAAPTRVRSAAGRVVVAVVAMRHAAVAAAAVVVGAAVAGAGWVVVASAVVLVCATAVLCRENWEEAVRFLAVAGGLPSRPPSFGRD